MRVFYLMAGKRFRNIKGETAEEVVRSLNTILFQYFLVTDLKPHDSDPKRFKHFKRWPIVRALREKHRKYVIVAGNGGREVEGYKQVEGICVGKIIDERVVSDEIYNATDEEIEEMIRRGEIRRSKLSKSRLEEALREVRRDIRDAKLIAALPIIEESWIYSR